VLYSFRGGADGASPDAGLISVNGELYGTTYFGGAANSSVLSGTVFKISPSGVERVLHSFGGGADGANPHAGLIDVNGELYGTTGDGGEHGEGSLFEVSPSGAESVLYSFGASGDGTTPLAGLIYVNGALFGTTYFGGANGSGTVFEVSPPRAESVLHSFGSLGGSPEADLIDVNGELYGTMPQGGSNGDYFGYVFKIGTSGQESHVYQFKGGNDGAYPLASLIDVNGDLYGTTFYGGGTRGTGCIGSLGCGTVFKIAKSGMESVIYRFRGGADGAGPEGGLVDVNGDFYGTTTRGGAVNGGTVFEVSPSGVESVLHSFGVGTDGATPQAGLIDMNGLLYGTTSFGGISRGGNVFVIRP
jgi:uncharacterized repeat protein (TIGR03803 family)